MEGGGREWRATTEQEALTEDRGKVSRVGGNYSHRWGQPLAGACFRGKTSMPVVGPDKDQAQFTKDKESE